MRPLSPVDAISPAFSRTRTILTPPAVIPGQPSPFRFWFFIKIALVAALTQSSFYGMGFSLFGNAIGMTLIASGIGIRGTHSDFIVRPSSVAVAFMAAAVIAALLALALWVLLGWLWCRLRFTLFDLVLYCRGRIGLAWAGYGRQAWRYLGLMILVALGLLLIFAMVAGPLLLHLFVMLRHLSPSQINASPSVLFAHILPLYGVIFLFALVAALADAVMQDFLLPPMAIENAPLELAAGRFFDLLRTNFRSVVLYLLLRFVLELGLTLVGMLVVLLVFMVLGAGGAGVGFLLYHALWHAGPGAIALFLLYCVVTGLLLLGLYLLAMIAVYGAVATLKQSYAVYFFGSYYQALGDRLDPVLESPPSPPPPPSEAPPFDEPPPPE